MPASNESPFGPLVPGFEFLQGLARNASSALPGIGQWIAPTLDPEEIDKRIAELRTVQFWLEQNARLIASTIQALEVQRMTLTTLKSMNVPIAALRDSLQARPPDVASPPAKPNTSPNRPPNRPTNTPTVDPMQWWGALTQQFTDLAASALQDALKDRPAAVKATATTPTTVAAPASAATVKPTATPTATPADKAPERPARRRERSAGPAAP